MVGIPNAAVFGNQGVVLDDDGFSSDNDGATSYEDIVAQLQVRAWTNLEADTILQSHVVSKLQVAIDGQVNVLADHRVLAHPEQAQLVKELQPQTTQGGYPDLPSVAYASDATTDE